MDLLIKFKKTPVLNIFKKIHSSHSKTPQIYHFIPQKRLQKLLLMDLKKWKNSTACMYLLVDVVVHFSQLILFFFFGAFFSCNFFPRLSLTFLVIFHSTCFGHDRNIVTSYIHCVYGLISQGKRERVKVVGAFKVSFLNELCSLNFFGSLI